VGLVLTKIYDVFFTFHVLLPKFVFENALKNQRREKILRAKKYLRIKGNVLMKR
jgi:hypothetical protein